MLGGQNAKENPFFPFIFEEKTKCTQMLYKACKLLLKNLSFLESFDKF